MRRLVVAVAAMLVSLAGSASADMSPQLYVVARGLPNGAVIWYGIAITDSSGRWAATFPAGTFTTAPMVLPQALSADTTLANSATASLTAQSSAGASGYVTLPATIVVGGMAIKAAGAGITVDVVAVGF